MRMLDRQDHFRSVSGQFLGETKMSIKKNNSILRESCFSLILETQPMSSYFCYIHNWLHLQSL